MNQAPASQKQFSKAGFAPVVIFLIFGAALLIWGTSLSPYAKLEDFLSKKYFMAVFLTLAVAAAVLFSGQKREEGGSNFLGRTQDFFEELPGGDTRRQFDH